MKHSR